MKALRLEKHLFSIKYWPSWLAVFLWWLTVQILPLPIQIYLGNRLGDLIYKRNISRKRIAQRNIEMCYPELSTKNQQKLVQSILRETSVAIFESGAAWFWPNIRFKGKYRIEGIEHIREAQAAGKGVLLLGIHFTTIEIGAAIVNLEFPISGFYRPHTNAVYEYIQATGRTRRNEKSHVIANGDVRGIVKALRNGAIVNYAPDQDYGRDRSVFAPFFNIQAATVKAPTQLANAGKAEIIPWTTRRDPETNKYIITLLPPMTNKLNRSPLDDATTINAFIESEVRKNPEQYLWVHRRFKTRPDETEDFYK